MDFLTKNYGNTDNNSQLRANIGAGTDTTNQNKISSNSSNNNPYNIHPSKNSNLITNKDNSRNDLSGEIDIFEKMERQKKHQVMTCKNNNSQSYSKTQNILDKPLYESDDNLNTEGSRGEGGKKSRINFKNTKSSYDYNFIGKTRNMVSSSSPDNIFYETYKNNSKKFSQTDKQARIDSNKKQSEEKLKDIKHFYCSTSPMKKIYQSQNESHDS